MSFVSKCLLRLQVVTAAVAVAFIFTGCAELLNDPSIPDGDSPKTKPVAVTGIKLNQNVCSVLVDAELKLIATVLPARASDKTVTWTSNNTEIATVDEDGMVRGLSRGRAIITASAGNEAIFAQCAVTVTSDAVSVQSVAFAKKTLRLMHPASEKLGVNILPNNATNIKVSFASSDLKVATVDETGLVATVGKGNARITVTSVDGGFSDTCNLTVTVDETVRVTGVSLNKSSAEILGGATNQIVATVEPGNATNKAVTFSSQNASIATVNAAGLITAVNTGNTNITVTTADGGFSAVCNVEVIPNNSVRVIRVSFLTSQVSAARGNTFQTSINVTPWNATNSNVFYESSNPSVATIDASGLVTAINYGSTTLKVITEDGGFTSTCGFQVLNY